MKNASAVENVNLQELLELIRSEGNVLMRAPGSLERPVHGTTLFLAEFELELSSGNFRVYAFRDIIRNSYILALVHGDVQNAKKVYTRIHSSCVTSETLRACDCDCVEQLEGALEIIAQRGNGVLFYLLQEGRGVGYFAKARDRMLVQASLDTISTFAAYEHMGLARDYRVYESIASIRHLLGISAPFIVLTNNPDKIQALADLGVPVSSTEQIEFEPGPYNLAYLTSKAEAGHILARPKQSIKRSSLPPEPVVPFNPEALESLERFIYAACYYLPMRPVENQVVFSLEQAREAIGTSDFDKVQSALAAYISSCELLSGDRFRVQLRIEALSELEKNGTQNQLLDLLTTPYWFRVHVYHDVVSTREYVVAVYGSDQTQHSDATPIRPLIRLQSESLLNRFPLKDPSGRRKLSRATQAIVEHGFGLIMLLQRDGRGAGFGAHATDLMLRQAGHSQSSDQSYQRIGVEYDSRDYDAAVRLLKHHVGNCKVELLMNSVRSVAMKGDFTQALSSHGIDVANWRFLEGGQDGA